MKRKYMFTGVITLFILSILFFILYYPLTPSNLNFIPSECEEDLTNAVIIGTFSIENQAKEIEKIKEASGKDIQPINEGMQDYSWIDDNTFYAKAVVLINCAEKIKYGDYEVTENRLILKYKIKKPFSGAIAECMCAQELTYTIKEIEKKDYQLELVEI